MTRVAVVGGAAGGLEELERLGDWPGLIVGVNDTAGELRRLDHLCTLHPEKLPEWLEARVAQGLPGTPVTWGWAGAHPRHVESCDRVIKGWASGSSGLFAVSVALLELRASQIVLCGVPMGPEVNRWRGEPWIYAFRHRPQWEERRREMAPHVRSWSGWTRQLLGAPTAPWLGADLTPLTRWRLSA